MRRIGQIGTGLAAAAMALALAGTASAQTATPDPQKLELARQIMAANGGVEATQNQLKTMFAGIGKLVQSSLPADMPAQATSISQTMMKYMMDEEMKAVPGMIEDTAEVYAEHLSVQELKDMLAWSKSSSAQAIRVKMPEVTGELMQRQAPLMKKMMSGAMKTAVDKTCEENHCTAEERQTLAAIVAKVAPAS